MVKKGPKYRLPRKINWRRNHENIIEFLDDYITKWIREEKADRRSLDNWKQSVLEKVDGRIEKGKQQLRPTKSVYFSGQLKRDLDNLKSKFVITCADKAQNNVILT